MNWLSDLLSGFVSIFYQVRREEEKLADDREEERVKDIEESDQKLREELEGLARKRAK